MSVWHMNISYKQLFLLISSIRFMFYFSYGLIYYGNLNYFTINLFIALIYLIVTYSTYKGYFFGVYLYVFFSILDIYFNLSTISSADTISHIFVWNILASYIGIKTRK